VKPYLSLTNRKKKRKKRRKGEREGGREGSWFRLLRSPKACNQHLPGI
jgi:hypothetical protein